MKSAKSIRSISIPSYSLGEELFNAISHGLGALASIAALVLMVVKARGALPVTAVTFFGVTMILLYTISCVYHALSRNLKGKKVLRVLDHCTVFLLVLGTYVPVALLGVGGVPGWVVLGVIFAFTATGISLTAVNMEKYRVAAVICHLASGWFILVEIPRLLFTMGRQGVIYLVLGGVMYTVGSVLYGLGSRRKYMHSVFHIFCLLGTFFHFWAVYICLL
ncbi:MAG: hemolysin III family protein [Clostridia bacterium]|nr:hemolysin III family protein [Clostridia bacterium]